MNSPTQYKLVPLKANSCPHDAPPNENMRCPSCNTLFISIEYDEWVSVGSPPYIYPTYILN